MYHGQSPVLLLRHYYVIFHSEHQEIMQQIHETTDTRIRDDLERELDVLIARMEAKGDQIAKLRRHKEKVRVKQGPCGPKHINYQCAIFAVADLHTKNSSPRPPTAPNSFIFAYIFTKKCPRRRSTPPH